MQLNHTSAQCLSAPSASATHAVPTAQPDCGPRTARTHRVGHCTEQIPAVATPYVSSYKTYLYTYAMRSALYNHLLF